MLLYGLIVLLINKGCVTSDRHNCIVSCDYWFIFHTLELNYKKPIGGFENDI